jgi:hypothetical protein
MKNKIWNIIQLVIALLIIVCVFKPVGKLVYRGYVYEKHTIERNINEK